MKSLPSLLGLVAFDAVARHLSFSRAGRELHITQGAVSHRIRSLEDELGVVLLARTSRRVRLTEPGRVLQQATALAFGRLREGLLAMEALGDNRRLTVSCSPSFAIRWLVPRLADLRIHAPEVDLHVSAEDDLVEPGVGSIDFCIRFGAGGYDGVEAEQLTKETVTPVCSPLYLEREGLRGMGDLARCQLLHDDVLVGHAAHVGWRQWLDAAGLETVSAARGLRFSHSHLALDAAAAAQGIALARRSLVHRQLEANQLVTPFDVELHSDLTYWLITPRRGPQKDSLRQFRAWIRAALGSQG